MPTPADLFPGKAGQVIGLALVIYAAICCVLAPGLLYALFIVSCD